MDYPIKLSGSFGEPRTNHFHSGLDFKRNKGVPFDTIRAVKDGFISRINVYPDSYGNAIYIDHEDNYTSVYAHLDHFSPRIRKYIEEVLIRERQHMTDHQPKAESLPVRKGEYIGIMGNTGRSSAAHLHFEIRKTDSEVPLNPMLLGFMPKDNVAPVIRGVTLYVLSPDGEELQSKYFSAQRVAGSRYKLATERVAFGSLIVGVGIHAYDQMDGASNHNGIYSLEQFVDGTKNFAFELDEMPFHQSLYIHSHMDYEAKRNNRYITKCFRNVNNPLNIYDTDERGGSIPLFETAGRKVHIKVKDFHGNTSEIAFELIRSENWEDDFSELFGDRIRVSYSDSLFQDLGSASVELFDGSFVKPERIKIDCQNDSIIDLSQGSSVPLFKQLKLSFPHLLIQHPKEKYLIISKSGSGGYRQYVSWENENTLVCYTRQFGKYELQLDTVRPSIRIINLPGPKSARIKMQLTDNYEPVDRRDFLKFDLLVDGEWKLCKWDIKNNTIWYDMPDRPKRQKHQLEIRVRDASGNESKLSREFVY